MSSQDTCIGLVSNDRMQATAGGLAVLNNRVGRAPAAPDAERYAHKSGRLTEDYGVVTM
jgi:hypothetical protein